MHNRLSEDPNVKVLILEAGGKNLPEAVQVPYRWNELLLTELDWAYLTEPQTVLNGRQIYLAAGKAIGGSSILYHMMHVPRSSGRLRQLDLQRMCRLVIRRCPALLPEARTSDRQHEPDSRTRWTGQRH